MNAASSVPTPRGQGDSNSCTLFPAERRQDFVEATSYFTRDEVQNHLSHSEVIYGKIGFGYLKSGRIVYSDLKWIANPLGKYGRFITCFTNIDYDPYTINHMLWTFLEAVRTYQSAARPAAAAPAATAAPGASGTP
jgi:hypothetical protein